MNGPGNHPLYCRVTIAGAVSDRFARGCLCRVVTRTPDGASILECGVPTAARVGAVLTGLANLGVEVLAVDMGERDRHAQHGGGSR